MGSTSTQLHVGASLSSGSSSWKFDVFLSFAGRDTRGGFVDHLFSALLQKGIFMFKDDVTLERGEYIRDTLLKAIEESRFAIVIFSENYASSKWCLLELVKILDCKKTRGLTVFPVFYKLNPSNLRKQTGSVREAFARHERDYSEEEVQTWRNAVMEVAGISGWDSENGTTHGLEAKLVQEIVKVLQSKLEDEDSSILDYVVGLDTRVEEVKSLLGIGLNDSRIVGIHGIGGIGKTTVAKAVYNQIRSQFDASSYVKNVREAHREENHCASLQKLLISDIFSHNVDIKNNVDRGRSIIMRRARHMRVLVVFDDVDDAEDLKALIGNPEYCLGLGSRIIIITRYPRVLDLLEVKHKYDVKELEYEEALELFCQKVFGKNQPTQGYEGLTNSFLHRAGGVPLVLKVLVPILRGLSINEWQSAFDRLRQQPHEKIHSVLKLSYESLEPKDKEIFLDIACFFEWNSKDFVIEILNACDFNADYGIRNLQSKALVKISDNRIEMHDLIREMGRHIIYEEHRKEPGKRSRLWKYEDVYDVLTQKKGTELPVEAIVMDSCETKKISLRRDAFSNMSNLRLLSLQGVVELLDGAVDNLSNKLRLLEWPQYPLKFLPANFQADRLVKLKMSHSGLKQPWNGTMCLDKLKYVDLNYSSGITKISCFTPVTNLKELILDGCTRLVKIDPSIEAIKSLTILNLGGCKYLEFLPTGSWLESLQILVLSGCSKLKNVYEVLEFTKCLIALYLDETCVKELPVEHLSNLQLIFLSDCKKLTSLPSGICGLKRLAYLIVNGCSKLSELPEGIGELESLVELRADFTAIEQLPSSIIHLKKLRFLSLRGCGGRVTSTPRNSLLPPCLFPKKGQDPMGLDLPPLSGLLSLEKLNLLDCTLLQGGLPNDLGSLSSLKFLYLSGSNIISLPDSIRGLEKLTFLNLRDCKMLKTMLNLPTNIDCIVASGCTSLETLPDPLPRKLTIVDLTNCPSLEKNRPSLPVELLRNCLKAHLSQNNNVEPEFTAFLPGRKIQNIKGPCVRMQLMPDWHKNLKGFAACVVFEAKATSEAFSPYLSLDLLRRRENYVRVECYGMRNDVVYATDFAFSFRRRIQSDHLLLDYMALDDIVPEVGVNDWKTWTDIIFYVSYNPEMFASVKTTVHMAYENGEERANPDESIQQSDRVEFGLIEWIRGVVLRKRRPYTCGYGYCFEHKAGRGEPLDIIYRGPKDRFFSDLCAFPQSFCGGHTHCPDGRTWAREGPPRG
ncbi:TMV resistance protein N-like [Diospyros lotus]|uniref:TMV resistance protein N-like n=1 Tax=Diospyros lotus TaxID=55363 RepID=UPI0022512329|nr:TMV resistance protein N-like [Diospyros lotus]